MCQFVVTPPEETNSALHQPPPGSYFKYLHRIQKYSVCFFLRAQRVVIQPVMNNCRFRITTMRREHRPEKARYTDQVRNVPCGDMYHIIRVIRQSEFKRFNQTPAIITEHFQHGWGRKFTHSPPLPASLRKKVEITVRSLYSPSVPLFWFFCPNDSIERLFIRN